MDNQSRSLAFELVRVTEAAALVAGRFIGRDDKIAADQAAVDAMRGVLNSIEMNAVVVIGEGEKDEAPMLYNGEVLGAAKRPQFDLAVDPIDGTTPLAKGRENSIATVAIAPRGAMFKPGPFVYMDKLAVGPKCKGLVDINDSVESNLKIIAEALNKEPQDVIVVILDRPRHEELIAQVRKFGASIRLITDGDVIGALAPSMPEMGVDVLMGIGGTPEGILAACGIRALGGEIQGRLHARDESEIELARQEGYEPDQVLTLNELVSTDDVVFAATGITDGSLLHGVRYERAAARTESILIYGGLGTMRRIQASHRF